MQLRVLMSRGRSEAWQMLAMTARWAQRRRAKPLLMLAQRSGPFVPPQDYLNIALSKHRNLTSGICLVQVILLAASCLSHKHAIEMFYVTRGVVRLLQIPRVPIHCLNECPPPFVRPYHAHLSLTATEWPIYNTRSRQPSLIIDNSLDATAWWLVGPCLTGTDFTLTEAPDY